MAIPSLGLRRLGQFSPVKGIWPKARRLVDVGKGDRKEAFSLSWGKTGQVTESCNFAVAKITSRSGSPWEIELRAYDDGVAFRYRFAEPDEVRKSSRLRDEVTSSTSRGEPTALFNALDGFTTSHESLYDRQPLSAIPAEKLIDMPLLLTWPDGPAAAITEARVRQFAGMYLERPSSDDRGASRPAVAAAGARRSVRAGKTPHESPWRVVLLADTAGKLLESNLLLCLNDPPEGDFSWA